MESIHLKTNDGTNAIDGKKIYVDRYIECIENYYRNHTVQNRSKNTDEQTKKVEKSKQKTPKVDLGN